MSNFDFLTSEWKDIHEAASKVESAAIPDPRTSCFYARRTLELAARWAYKFDRALKLPYQDNLSALIHEPTFKHTAGDAVFNKATFPCLFEDWNPLQLLVDQRRMILKRHLGDFE